MNIDKVDKWLDDKFGISYSEMVKIKNFLSEENERKENDIKDLTYQLAMTKAELDEANDSATWWHNRYKAVQRELEKHKKCELKQRIEKAVEYINHLSKEPNVFGHYGIHNDCAKWLLNILNGRSDE